MPAKRTRAKARSRKLPPQMRAAAERLRELDEAHMAAICGGDQSFYEDGRHEELVNLLPVIHEALGIRPWEDGNALTGASVDAANDLITVVDASETGAARNKKMTFAELKIAAAPTVTESFIIACSDETTALTAGTAKATFRLPYAFTVTAVYASLTTAQTSGSIFTVDINEAGTTILSTKLTIDNTEDDSATAATAAVISDASLAARAKMTVDIDQIGDGTAKGLKVTIVGHQ